MIQRLLPLTALCLAVLSSWATAQGPLCQTVWAQNVVSSNSGANASSNSSGPTSALGAATDDFFALGDGGNIVVDFGQPFTNGGDSNPDLCVDEWGVQDCYFVCLDPADAATEVALIAAGMGGGPTYYEFSVIWCGDNDIDIDALVPGYAAGQLVFDKVMILDDSNGGDGAEIDRICANVCTGTNSPPSTGNCTTVWAAAVEASNQGANADSSNADPNAVLGNDLNTRFSLGNSGQVAVSFGAPFTTSGDSQVDLCVREWNANDCYYICFDPADAATEAALLAAGMSGGPTYFEFSMTWCGDTDLDLDALVPGYAAGQLRFDKVMIFDDGDGGNGGEILAVCALICTPALGKIGDFVWRDNDCDGIQDPSEPGVEGLTLTLRKQSDNSVVGTTTTDQNGAWCFTDLEADDYLVELAYNQVSWALTTPLLGGDANLDSDFDGLTAQVLVSLAAGDQRTDIDAGLCVICPGPPVSQVSLPCGYDPIYDPVIAVSDLIPGEPITLSMQSQFPGATGFIFYSIGPVTPYSLAGCTFYVDVLNQATNVFLAASFFTDAAGNWDFTTTDTLPLAYLGLEVIFQGRICSPGNIPGPFAPLPDFFSNAIVATIGCP